ncbi:pentapeptide repeat-containing protein [uncultured Endozoicomonas sp.]|uniref:pentapeptide repeat-containing protein n=1 Tax=uncultured Endozoicomonas sp. TaxID=432652 RepID=UPI00261A7709|nr:pentapeptide repeat-containing protein [uncultured Endozoicomonas sp.]
MSQNKQSSSSPHSIESGSDTSVNSALDTDGVRTPGINPSKGNVKKGVSNYQVKTQPGLVPQLEFEKDKAARRKALLGHMHPGAKVPEGVDFSDISMVRLDMERVRFQGSLMRRCKFNATKLRGTRFKNCDLRGADFRKADLRDCILDGCNLNGADLRKANLTNARIIDSDLSAASFDQAILDSAVIENCDMVAQTFHQTSCQKICLFNSHIIHGFFDNTDFSKAEIRDVEFRHCTLTKTFFNDADISGVQFKGCESFEDGPSFVHTRVSDSVFTDCDLQSVNLTGTEFKQCIWKRIIIRDAQLDDTSFHQVDFNASHFADCFSLEKAPSFSSCRMDHLCIEHTDLTTAVFRDSAFIGATIRDSDFSEWDLKKTKIDDETVIEQ